MRASLIRISSLSDATSCLSCSFSPFDRVRAIGLLTAHPPVYAIPNWANEMTVQHGPIKNPANL